MKMPSLTHSRIINRERKKYGKDWLTFIEIGYGGFIFDLMAFNPKTKQIEIVEVDLVSETSEEKVKFAETFAKVKVFRPLGEKIARKAIQPILDALSNPTRLAMLESLCNTPKQYNELARQIGFYSSKDAGKFVYHLKRLLSAKLIKPNIETKKYEITEKGIKIIDFVLNLDRKP